MVLAISIPSLSRRQQPRKPGEIRPLDPAEADFRPQLLRSHKARKNKTIQARTIPGFSALSAEFRSLANCPAGQTLPGHLRAGSCLKSKGLEAAAVLLLGLSLDPVSTQRDALITGASRARQLLTVLTVENV